MAAGIMRDRHRRQPPPMAAAPVGRRDGDEIDDRNAGDQPAENKAPRRPASRATQERSARPAKPLRTQASFCRSATAFGMNGSAWKRSRAKALRAIARHAARSEGFAGSIPFAGIRQRQIAREGDQALDGPETGGFQRADAAAIRCGDAAGTKADALPRPGPSRRDLFPTSGLARAPRPLRIVRR